MHEKEQGSKALSFNIQQVQLLAYLKSYEIHWKVKTVPRKN